ncbi:MAG: VacJ family lipoprotein [Alphaproteobacteria bacterium]|nr:VacJ family lipoprotein [Alphaproteobacteria bacterium]
MVKLLGTDLWLRLKPFASAMLVVAVLAGCAGTPKTAGDTIEDISDPIEPINRVFFEFNMFLDRTILRPVTRFYVDYVPEAFRVPVRNVLELLNTPVVMMNELLQGDIDRFMHTAGRFTVNLVAGFGILDIAGEKAPPLDEDFGQTLAVWGVPSGPYLMLPLLGPSNIRDAVGRGVDTVADPAPYIVSNHTSDTNSYLFSGTRLGATAIDNRSRILGELEELERTSLDFYATVRSLYTQKRRDDIRNGGSGEPVPIPEISFERDDSIQRQRSSATTR